MADVRSCSADQCETLGHNNRLHMLVYKLIMENSPSLLNPLTSPALMVMASAAADSSRGPTASPCQQQFGVPVTVENSVPFLGASYSLAAMYHHSERLSGAREFHSSHLLPFPHPPTFGHPGLGGYGTLRPFHPTHMPFPDEVERFSNAYAAAVAAANASVSDTKQANTRPCRSTQVH
uniref:Uncharacterized protein n=1 Tax=Erpetoichthys calabaricus TaxID=27687 RepID=A0A8C4T9P4_ERPCA